MWSLAALEKEQKYFAVNVSMSAGEVTSHMVNKTISLKSLLSNLACGRFDDKDDAVGVTDTYKCVLHIFI